jgi:hypothetical protein
VLKLQTFFLHFGRQIFISSRRRRTATSPHAPGSENKKFAAPTFVVGVARNFRADGCVSLGGVPQVAGHFGTAEIQLVFHAGLSRFSCLASRLASIARRFIVKPMNCLHLIWLRKEAVIRCFIIH